MPRICTSGKTILELWGRKHTIIGRADMKSFVERDVTIGDRSVRVLFFDAYNEGYRWKTGIAKEKIQNQSDELTLTVGSEYWRFYVAGDYLLLSY